MLGIRSIEVSYHDSSRMRWFRIPSNSKDFLLTGTAGTASFVSFSFLPFFTYAQRHCFKLKTDRCLFCLPFVHGRYLFFDSPTNSYRYSHCLKRTKKLLIEIIHTFTWTTPCRRIIYNN